MTSQMGNMNEISEAIAKLAEKKRNQRVPDPQKETQMEALLKRVASSNIAAIGHDAGIHVLYVKFLSGGLYSYYPVSSRTFRQFNKAKSKGEFFHQNIKDNAKLTVNKIMETK